MAGGSPSRRRWHRIASFCPGINLPSMPWIFGFVNASSAVAPVDALAEMKTGACPDNRISKPFSHWDATREVCRCVRVIVSVLDADVEPVDRSVADRRRCRCEPPHRKENRRRFHAAACAAPLADDVTAYGDVNTMRHILLDVRRRRDPAARTELAAFESGIDVCHQRCAPKASLDIRIEQVAPRIALRAHRRTFDATEVKHLSEPGVLRVTCRDGARTHGSCCPWT